MSGADDFRTLFGRGRVSRFLPEGGYGLPQQMRPAGYDIIEGSGFIADGAVYDGSFAASIDPVLLRATATLTNADAIANPDRVAFNTDDLEALSLGWRHMDHGRRWQRPDRCLRHRRQDRRRRHQHDRTQCLGRYPTRDELGR